MDKPKTRLAWGFSPLLACLLLLTACGGSSSSSDAPAADTRNKAEWNTSNWNEGEWQ